MSKVEQALALFPVQILTAVGISVASDLILSRFLNTSVLSSRVLRTAAWMSVGPASMIALSAAYRKDVALVGTGAAILVGLGLELYNYSYLNSQNIAYSWSEAFLTSGMANLAIISVAVPAICYSPTR